MRGFAGMAGFTGGPRVRGGGAVSAPAVLVDHLIVAGHGSNTPVAPATVTLNATDTYAQTRNGLTFGKIAGTAADGGGNNGGSASQGSRFQWGINLGSSPASGGTSQFEFDLPDGTYTVEAAFGVDFGASTNGIRIINKSGGAVLHSMTATSAAAQPADITGVQRTMAAWDATRATVSIVVTGGQGVLVDRGTAGAQNLNYIRFQQTA